MKCAIPSVLGIALTLPVFAGASVHMTVNVADALSSRPVYDPVIHVYQRPTKKDRQGRLHLFPLNLSESITNSIMNQAGLSTVEVDLPQTGIYAVSVEAEGYLGQTETMLNVQSGQDAPLTFRLIPATMTPDQTLQLQEIHGQERLLAAPAQGNPEQTPVEPRDVAQFVTVPDEVMVDNLNGFTGMINLDEYIAGVVTAEMNDGFPPEALRAQAVASRSFALYRLQRKGFANGEQAYNSSIGTRSRDAATFTTKQVLTYDGSIIQAYFSARCNGDFTLNSEDGPSLFNCVRGGLRAGVVPYCRSRPCSGHINCSSLSPGTESCCTVTIAGKNNYIFGHGVGLCQRGAQQYADRDHLNYVTILNRFYTGVTLETAQADLTIVEPVLASPSSVAVNGTIRVDWVEKNKGQGTSSPAHNTKIFLSTTPYGTTHQIGYYRSITALAPGESKSHIGSDLVIPPSVPTGDYYITVYIDSDSNVAESDEYNNIGSSSPDKITVNIDPPKRIISLNGDLTFGAVMIGQQVTKTFMIANSGNETLSVTRVSLPLGYSANWRSGTIPSGGSQTVQVTFAPTSPVPYNGILNVDSDATSGEATLPLFGQGQIQGPAITTITDGGDAGFRIGISGDAGKLVVIEVSDDLQTWQELARLPNPSGLTEYVDTTTRVVQQFYRFYQQ